MSVPRREGLVRLARKYDALIISDDVYDFLQWPASGGSLSPLTDGPSDLHLPRLSDIDRALDGASPHGFGNAVSNGSFSKIIGPGVRTGWIEGTTAFITGLGMTGSTNSGGCPSHLTAAMIATIVDSGELEAYIDSTVRPALQRRHRATVDALHKYVLPHGIQLRETSLIGSDTYGGYFIWFTLDDGLSAKLVSKIARDEENLVVAPGAIFEVHGDESSATFDNHLRLCFSWVDEEDLVEGARRLGSVMARVRANRQSYESRGIPELEDDFVNSLK